jgi:hypothetical protein
LFFKPNRITLICTKFLNKITTKISSRLEKRKTQRQLRRLRNWYEKAEALIADFL